MKSASVGEWLLRKVGDWIAICLLCLSSSPLTLAQTDHSLMQQDWWGKSGSEGSFSRLGWKVIDFLWARVCFLSTCIACFYLLICLFVIRDKSGPSTFDINVFFLS